VGAGDETAVATAVLDVVNAGDGLLASSPSSQAESTANETASNANNARAGALVNDVMFGFSRSPGCDRVVLTGFQIEW
jgi:hypothetical protein